MREQDRFVALAAVTTPHGVHGRVKLKLFSESLESFKALSKHIIRENGSPVTLKVTGEAGGAPVAAINEIKNRNDADLWRGVVLGIARDKLPAPDTDEFYVEDLIGLKLTTANGVSFGTITTIENYGAGDIIVIETVKGDEMMLPLTNANFPELNITTGTGVITPPDILAPAADEPRE